MINLNDSSFDGGSNVKIFNDGTAGIANDITVTIDKKKAEDKETAPDYKLVFTDVSGASCNTSFWYITKATDFATMDELTMKQGKILKHLAHAVLGDGFSFPEYPNAQAMLDGIMKLVRDGLPNAGKFRVFANYGSTMGIKKYIQVRSWVPFMEPMSVPESESRLSVSNIDAMERLVQDNVGAPAASAPVADDSDW
jgi:hypothetical protein